MGRRSVNILYFDCFAGISGNMMLGCLLDLGITLEDLQKELEKTPLPLSRYHMRTEKTRQGEVIATRFQLQVKETRPLRKYSDIFETIESSALSEGSKEKARCVFTRLAEAEARIYGRGNGQIRTREIALVSTFVNILGTAICLERLGIGELYSSPLPLGCGSRETIHGRVPIPGPVVAELLRESRIPVVIGPGGCLTACGAAIMASLGRGCDGEAKMTIEAVGHGADGGDACGPPNLLRVFMGRTNGVFDRDEIYVMETHIDDMNPEVLGFLMGLLFEAGALDVVFSPIQMKKNRPGVRLTILTPPWKLGHLARLVLTESTAIGLRYYPVKRVKTERFIEERSTSLGKLKVKVIREGKKLLRVAPEYEECRRISLEKGIPLLDVYRIVEKETGGP